MALSVNPELEQRIEANAAAQGLTVDAYLQSLLTAVDEEHALELAEFQQRVDGIIASLDRGESVDGETFMEQLIVKAKSTPVRRAG